MRLVHLTPGTGSFFCGSCLRDVALVQALGRRGHDVEVIPLYLPLVVEEPHAGAPQPRVFMGGINLYLQQMLPVLGRLPSWLTRRLDAPRLLRWSAGHGDMTRARGLGPMTVSMLRGEEGRQAGQLEVLLEWMRDRPRPEVICLSNALLCGMARRLKEELGCPLVCTLQGEAPFLDALPAPHRAAAWEVLRQRAADVDAFAAVSAWYGQVMAARLRLERVRVVHNGIDLEDFPAERELPPGPPVIGFLARLCADKGLPTLVEAFIRLRRAGRCGPVRLAAAGAALPPDRRLLRRLRRRLARAGLAGDASFRPNVSRREKLEFLRSLHVLSVPATYGEAFGLYVLEAMACGVPVVQPRHGAFPEILEATGGGLLCAPDDEQALAEALESLLLEPARAASLGRCGQAEVRRRFTSDHMAAGVEELCMMVAP
jgi:glycosyltransferase involved in cell wall biosynthesis